MHLKYKRIPSFIATQDAFYLQREAIADSDDSEHTCKICNAICSALCAVNIDPVNGNTVHICIKSFGIDAVLMTCFVSVRVQPRTLLFTDYAILGSLAVF